MNMKTFLGVVAVAILVCSIPTPARGWGQEHFGNQPLNESNYREWKGFVPVANHSSRVYHTWVNGNEHFYCQGDAAALADCLKHFAALPTPVHEVVLRPGPGTVKSFDGKKTIAFGWEVHLRGGISRGLENLPGGDKIWPKSPRMTIYVDDKLDLAKLEIPAGVALVELADLGRRNREALASTDKTVRGWGSGDLARLDPYDAEHMAAVAKLLDDPDNWVRLNAAGALSVFGKKAEPLLPTLRKHLDTTDKQLKTRLQETIRAIEQSKDDPAAERGHRAMLDTIARFVRSTRERRS